MFSISKNRLIKTVTQIGVVLLVGCQTAFAATTLERVKEQGQFKCGASGEKPGLALIDSKGQWSGFDVDICRAIAAAVFADPTKVELVPTSWPQVFVSLQSGAVDVMNRNATYTVGRDTAQGFDFFPVFYSGQGFMVRKDLGVTKVDDLADRTFCILSGSGIELNIADYFKRRNKPIEMVGFESYDVLYPAFEVGRCDVVSTEPVGLNGQRSKFANPTHMYHS